MHIIIMLASCAFAIIILLEIFPPRGVEQITVVELTDMLDEDNQKEYQYIDVRPVEQFNQLHVFGFKNIPIKDLKQNVDALSKDKKVVVICERGILGNEACKLLKRQGFSDLANVRGGIITWVPYR